MFADSVRLAAAKVGADGRGEGGLLGYAMMIFEKYQKLFFKLVLRILDFEMKTERKAQLLERRRQDQTRKRQASRRSNREPPPD